MASIENVKPTPVRAAESAGVKGWWDNSRNFLAEVRNEMKRVTWPSGREVYATTIVVILVSAFFGLYLWVIDLTLASAVHWLFARVGA